ncbi:NAD(P)H-dependent flavin oxidoreductase [Mycolicibacterium vanbaalenii]|uniref:2-nitropropane dioxygenase, NPD n=1 Tax=Mycolicibacterium vanbaalenii (strain DSM 7251 / JCM 13017 / BCRC 16820 / KCTC 9966 / NRRL B-24157 / PYR-1) TaxID=350058 RepID=A1T1Z5_MYCVP|nr:2-nitropropane dioxygenase, NPD [Mycolicibacterium vanbaalenii PYR-1]
MHVPIPSRILPWAGRLRLPVIAAPMTSVSTPELVIGACRSGAIGSFPTHNAATTRELDAWLARAKSELAAEAAPVAPNLVVHRSNPRRDDDLAVLIHHKVELVITSVGSPAPVIEPLHNAGARVFADVASLEHAWRALDAGADGLVLLTAGAGGQTGWANPFAFVRAVRENFDGPVVLAGGISDGRAILAAQILGADFAYLGTRFIATRQSAAGDDYRDALVAATLDDVRLSDRVGGVPASLLSCWLDAQSTPGADGAGSGFTQKQLLANREAWSAGHSVSGVHGVVDVADLVEELLTGYTVARRELKLVIGN